MLLALLWFFVLLFPTVVKDKKSSVLLPSLVLSGNDTVGGIGSLGRSQGLILLGMPFSKPSLASVKGPSLSNLQGAVLAYSGLVLFSMVNRDQQGLLKQGHSSCGHSGILSMDCWREPQQLSRMNPLLKALVRASNKREMGRDALVGSAILLS